VAEEAHFSGIAERYALAAFELAQEEKSLKAVQADFATLRTLIAESPELARFVSAPVFGREKQKKGMAAILKKMKAAPLTLQFVELMAAKRRLYLLADAIRAFDALVAAKKGEIAATVVAARPLAKTEIAELKRVLKAKLGQVPNLAEEVDPSLLGGLVVKIGSRMIDSSLRTKLNALHATLRGA